MTEEEKKAIEDLKEEINKPLEVPEDKFDTFILYNIESARIILNLIEKLQKERDIYYYEWKILEADLINKNLIPKDKIREKIKELEEEIKILNKGKDAYLAAEVDIQIEVLKELLEEE